MARDEHITRECVGKKIGKIVTELTLEENSHEAHGFYSFLAELSMTGLIEISTNNPEKT